MKSWEERGESTGGQTEDAIGEGLGAVGAQIPGEERVPS